MNKSAHQPEKDKDKEDLPGYPIYPASEDIYSKDHKVADISVESDEDPNDIGKKPITNKDDEPTLGEGLDVPGSDLDDEQEKIGAEDEENNYYSLGGDSHEDLEEGNDDLR